MATLDGRTGRIDLGRGISMIAPGVRGRAEVYDVSAGSTTRSTDVDGGTSALRLAMEQTDIRPLRVITLDVTQSPVPGTSPVRGPNDVDGMVVDVPDLGPEVSLVILAVDEAGVATWNFPVTAAESVSTRGSLTTVRFVIDATTPPVPTQGGDRGVIGYVGRKVLELLAVPLGPWALKPAARLAARHWEEKNRRIRVRRYEPATRRSGEVPDLVDADWSALERGRSLWFVHGTFSSTHGGFGSISEKSLAALHRLYDGRVVAYDHHTLGVDPYQNVDTLRSLLPAGASFEADIISHSRGGLLARALAGANGVESPLKVRRAVHVGTPNHGTPLADPKHLNELLNRTATMLNLAPPGPVGMAADSLSVVLTVVAIVARYGLSALPGLCSMDPQGEFLRTLNAEKPGNAEHFAVAADFEPTPTMSRMVRARNVGTDRIFGGAANDLVVPTAGVYDDATSLPIAQGHRLVLAGGRGVDHGGYFAQTDVMSAILHWLSE